MTIDVNTNLLSPEKVKVSVSGEIDMNTSDELRDVLMDAIDESIYQITVDMQEVNFIDSSGIATLVETMQELNSNNGQLILKNLREDVRSVFEIANLIDVFEIQ